MLDRCGAARCRASRGPGSRALLLAPLTRSCAAKPYGWHGGQSAQAATYRVNLRIKGPRPPPIGLTCAVTSARATTTTNQSNFARNSPPHISDFEIRPLELQRSWAISKNDRVKLRATFAGTVTAVTLGPLHRPREPRPRLATTNSFTKNRCNHHENLQSAAHPPRAPTERAPAPLRRSPHRRWGFCSIRSWLSACRRCVVVLMMRFPRLAVVRPRREAV